MAKCKIVVTRGSHHFKGEDGRPVHARKGDSFEGDDSLLARFPEKLARAPEPKPQAEPEPDKGDGKTAAKK